MELTSKDLSEMIHRELLYLLKKIDPKSYNEQFKHLYPNKKDIIEQSLWDEVLDFQVNCFQLCQIIKLVICFDQGLRTVPKFGGR